MKNEINLKIEKPIKEFYSSGQVRTETLLTINDEQHEFCRGWYENGQKEFETSYSSGLIHGTAKGWYENGQIEFSASYYSGKKHGLSESWHENGQKELEIPYYYGLKNGLVKIYDLNGQIELEQLYFKNKTITYKEIKILVDFFENLSQQNTQQKSKLKNKRPSM